MTPEEFWSILNNTLEPQSIFFRLYYDDSTGRPLFYSMEDVPGTYITIDRETYARSSMRVQVRNGKLVPVALPGPSKLVPGSGTACHPKDVALVIPDTYAHISWSLKTHETD
jgi:hypothetical protein